ncbi:hypothetical protein QO058_01580 [Bosea vestrisii]|uniref:hypothetical protein n=1 Tax=Bosea vestrisii TaxID=151416 RepID=UPI0024DF8895|nr:hypothetical protein [Bosea vestrisii]WID97003.1 hypothetical protein QO058_01580 [Bosea vestrisii]
MTEQTVTLTITDLRGAHVDVVLGAANPQIRDMYLAYSAAHACPAKWAAQEKAAIGIGVALAARRCGAPYAEFSLAKLMRIFPRNSLAEIAMAERMEFLRLLPCLKRFLINKPFWAGHAFDAALDGVRCPQPGDFWAHYWGADPADVRQAIAYGMARARAIAGSGLH